MGLEAFLLAQPFMEAREKKAVGTCPKGKQLKATPPSPAIHLSIHSSRPALLQWPLAVAWALVALEEAAEERPCPAEPFDRGGQEVGTRERVGLQALVGELEGR